jgi:S-DNA-T family DNA segregation ATPase FtsK/SpoIIIE
MPAIERGLPIIGHLPEQLREMLGRRLRELAGLALIALAAAGGAALATWNVQDPSLSHATSGPVRNILGFTGAAGADLLIQLFGLGSIALLLCVAVWGWRLLTHRLFDREIMRAAVWLLAAAFAAGFASCMPRTGAWPLPTGLGGVVGDAFLRLPAALFGPLGGISRLVFAAIFATVGLVCLVFACGYGSREREAPRKTKRSKRRVEEIEEDEDGDESERRFFAVTLGWCEHQVLSIKAWLMRLFASLFGLFSRDRDERAMPARRERREPRLDGRSPTLAPSSDDDEEEEDEEEEDEEEEEPAPRARKAKPASRGREKFELPPLSVLAAPRASERHTPSPELIEQNAKLLEGVLQDFGVRGEIVNARPGPVVTLYELEPAPGIKSSRVIGLADDIARSMSATAARVAVVAGRNAIGIELPNEHREKVYLREMLAAKEYNDTVALLPLCLGKTIGGEPVIADLARMPHLLIAGTTGSGKSVAINTMILSLVYRLTPSQCRLIMVDPKMLELSVYDGIPHLLTPVVTDPKKAVVALKWAVREMEERYKKMSKVGVRNIAGYNARLAEAKSKGEKLTRTVHTGFDKDTGKAIYEEEELDLEPLPFIVVIVDEMADLMMVAGKDIEGTVQRLAQMARAAGLHVILATQRPSVDVITGTIKANFPTRISFQVTSKIDSRTILGEQGAEQLLGQGDMLHMAGGGRISRVHGPFVSDEEVEKVVRHLKAQGTPQYLEAVTAEEEAEEDGAVFDGTSMGADGQGDLFHQAIAIVKRDRKASTSYIQRRLQIGYNRAASIMERMELEGIVGQPNHAGKREILVDEEDAGRF